MYKKGNYSLCGDFSLRAIDNQVKIAHDHDFIINRRIFCPFFYFITNSYKNDVLMFYGAIAPTYLFNLRQDRFICLFVRRSISYSPLMAVCSCWGSVNRSQFSQLT